MLVLEKINKSYNSGENELHVLKDISFTVNEGEFVSILGASGSGKSTLMNILGCMDMADSGSYILEGDEINNMPQGALAKLRNLKIGFIFQKYHLLPQYNVLQNISMPLLLRGCSKKEAESSAMELIENVGLAERIKHKPCQLSGGQQQRVAIARALVARPALLLADEPTGALDAQTGREILSLFKELNLKGNTIIQITHDEKVAKAASRIVRIEDGRIVQ